MSQSIFQVLSMDQRVIVYSSEADKIIITWNHSQTFSLFHAVRSPNAAFGECSFEEHDVKTYGGKKELTFSEARTFALNWATE